jgi:hypothetical protein
MAEVKTAKEAHNTCHRIPRRTTARLKRFLNESPGSKSSGADETE